MAAEPRGAQPPAARPLSPWALATLVCGLGLFCPAASLAGVGVGAWAAIDLRRRPWRRGGRMVALGLLLSVLSLAGWATALRWWQVNVRLPMLQGPLPELAAGLAGDVASFQAGFQPHDPATSPREAADFLDEVARRYGRLRGSSQRQREEPAPAPGADAKAAAPMVDLSRFSIRYTLHFDTGPVDAEAEFVVSSPGVPGFALRFSWLAIRDAERGNLCYPPGLCPAEAGAAP